MPRKNQFFNTKAILLLNAYVPVALWASLIFYLSNQPILPGFYVATYDFIFKKTAHITVYAILYLLFYRSQTLVTQGDELQRKIWLWPFIFVLLYAASDEFHQHFVPGRFGTMRDVGFDFLGAGLAFLKLYQYI